MQKCTCKILLLIVLVSQSWAFPSLFPSMGYARHSKQEFSLLSNPTSGYVKDQRVFTCPLRSQRRKAAAWVTECSASSGGPAGGKRSSEMIFSEYSHISGGDIQVHEMAQGPYVRYNCNTKAKRFIRANSLSNWLKIFTLRRRGIYSYSLVFKLPGCVAIGDQVSAVCVSVWQLGPLTQATSIPLGPQSNSARFDSHA
jgi:hypothetical protein